MTWWQPNITGDDRYQGGVCSNICSKMLHPCSPGCISATSTQLPHLLLLNILRAKWFRDPCHHLLIGRWFEPFWKKKKKKNDGPSHYDGSSQPVEFGTSRHQGWTPPLRKSVDSEGFLSSKKPLHAPTMSSKLPETLCGTLALFFV